MRLKWSWSAYITVLFQHNGHLIMTNFPTNLCADAELLELELLQHVLLWTSLASHLVLRLTQCFHRTELSPVVSIGCRWWKTAVCRQDFPAFLLPLEGSLVWQVWLYTLQRLDGNNDKTQTDPLLPGVFDPGFCTYYRDHEQSVVMMCAHTHMLLHRSLL